MTLVTTIGDPTQNSYGSLIEFAAYAALTAYDLTSFDQAAQEVALIQGARYLERGYESRWRGFRTNRRQGLAWPRRSRPANITFRSTLGYDGILDGDGFKIETDEIPQKVKEAQFEAAMLSLDGGDLLPSLERGGQIKQESDGAGPVRTSVTYASGASPRERFTTIEGLLQAYVDGHPGGSFATGEVVRA